MIIEIGLFVVGGVLLVKPVYHWAKRGVATRNAWQRWQHVLQSNKKGNEVAWLQVPSADIDILVLDSDKKDDLYQFPVLASSTRNLRMIMAHRDIHFRHLGTAAKGKTVKLMLPDRTNCFYKVVDHEILSPDQVKERLKEKSSENWLVLMTCYPFNYIGPAPKRFLLWCQPDDNLQGNNKPLHIASN